MNKLVAWEKLHNAAKWLSTPSGDFEAFMAANYWGESGLVFLDLGCATGGSTIFLAEKGFKVIAVDASESACTRLADNLTNKDLVQVVNADVTKLALKSRSIDCVIAANIFVCLEIEEAQALFKASSGWLKVGGRLFARILIEEPAPFARPELKLKYYSMDEVIKAMGGNFYGSIIPVTRYVGSN